MTLDEVIAELRERADRKVIAGMYRVGINPRGTLGIQIPELQKLARRIGTDHALALDLWATGVHEARILAAMVDDPAQATEEQMDHWAQGFDSWDVCDQVCKYLFGRSSFAYTKAREWAGHGGQFVKRASFVLIADLAANDKKASDEPFLEFLKLAEREAVDERNYVKKSVSWAVRQIGKRNSSLNKAALALAKRMKAQGPPPARWIASDVLRELSSAAVQDRLKRAGKAGKTGGQRRPKKKVESGGSDTIADTDAALDARAELEGGEAAGASETSERPPATRRRRGSRGGRSRKVADTESAGAEPTSVDPGTESAGAASNEEHTP